MAQLKVGFLLLVAAVGTHAQSFHLRNCPKPSLQVNFNITKYLGTWYEIEKLPAMFEKGKCIYGTFTLLSDGKVGVHNTELVSDGKMNSVGVATIKDPSQPAILSVDFFKGLPVAPYMVLSTDYNNYSLVYSCFKLGLFHMDFAWILSRSRELSEGTISQLHDRLTAEGVDVKRLSVTDQTGCDAVPSA